MSLWMVQDFGSVLAPKTNWGRRRWPSFLLFEVSVLQEHGSNARCCKLQTPPPAVSELHFVFENVRACVWRFYWCTEIERGGWLLWSRDSKNTHTLTQRHIRNQTMQEARLAGRLQKELKMLQDPSPGVCVWPSDELNLSQLEARMYTLSLSLSLSLSLRGLCPLFLSDIKRFMHGSFVLSHKLPAVCARLRCVGILIFNFFYCLLASYDEFTMALRTRSMHEFQHSLMSEARAHPSAQKFWDQTEPFMQMAFSSFKWEFLIGTLWRLANLVSLIFLIDFQSLSSAGIFVW
jgi:hypothetical protein